MRKSTKLAILVAALVALCSIAALAADTWKQDGDNWYCYDKDGNMIYGEARKSGSSYYYLDEATGAMAKNRLVDNGEGKYYYGEDGARVIGAWAKVAVENDGDGWEYMYFRPVTGKAYTDVDCGTGLKTINGKKYRFSSEGYMLYGYVAGSNWSSADYASAADYYFGEKTDGSAQTGWVNVKDGADDAFPNDASVWFYFKNGKKISNETAFKVASGKKYAFAKGTGVMITGWSYGTDTSAGKVVASACYYGGADEGQKVTKQWIKTDNFAGEDKNKWYYLTSTGVAHVPGVDKINGKFYLFNEDRQLVADVVASLTNDELDPKAFTLGTGKVMTFSTIKAFKDFDPATVMADPNSDFAKAAAEYEAKTGKTLTKDNVKIMFFSSDADTDGAMKVGTQTVTIDGETATVVFDKHGYALEGVSSKKIYVNGVLQSAGDDKVAVVKLRKTTNDYKADYYLVNAAGSILKNTKQIDANGIYYATKGEYAISTTVPTPTYKIYKFADKDYASNAATALLKADSETGVTFMIGKDTYDVSVGAVSGGVATVDWAKR